MKETQTEAKRAAELHAYLKMVATEPDSEEAEDFDLGGFWLRKATRAELDVLREAAMWEEIAKPAEFLFRVVTILIRYDRDWPGLPAAIKRFVAASPEYIETYSAIADYMHPTYYYFFGLAAYIPPARKIIRDADMDRFLAEHIAELDPVSRMQLWCDLRLRPTVKLARQIREGTAPISS